MGLILQVAVLFFVVVVVVDDVVVVVVVVVVFVTFGRFPAKQNNVRSHDLSGHVPFIVILIVIFYSETPCHLFFLVLFCWVFFFRFSSEDFCDTTIMVEDLMR